MQNYSNKLPDSSSMIGCVMHFGLPVLWLAQGYSYEPHSTSMIDCVIHFGLLVLWLVQGFSYEQPYSTSMIGHVIHFGLGSPITTAKILI